MPRKSPDGAAAPSPPPARRAKGSGSVRLRTDGRWEVRLTLTAPDGGKDRYSECLPTGSTQADAHTRLDALLAQQRAGQFITEHPTVNALLDAWLASLERRVTPPVGSKRAPTLRPSTLRYYRLYSTQYLRPRIGGVRVADLKATQVQALIEYWETHGLAPKSVAHMLGTLRTALNYAVRQDWVTRNVAAGRIFDLPYVGRPPIQPFTAAEARALLLAAAGTHEAALWTVLLAFGLRISEALGLTWTAWDETARTLAITQQLQCLDGTYSLAPLKTRQSRRVLQVPPAVTLALRGYRAQQAADRQAAGAAWDAPIPELMFTRPTGGPFTQSAIWRRLQALCKEQGLPPRSPHALRHTCAALLRDQGVPLDRIKEYLGHATLKTTIDVYGHPTAQGQAQAVEVLSRLLWETG